MGQKKDEVMTKNDFRRLLSWLDCSTDSQSQRYEEMRRRLIEYFCRRGCWSKDLEDLADRTFDRVAEWLDKYKNDEDYDPEPKKIFYDRAHYVLMEYRRSFEFNHSEFDDTAPPPLIDLGEEQREKEKPQACLEKCEQTLVRDQKLSADDVDLVTRYYCGEGSEKVKNHKGLADKYGLSAGALRTKACRIREKLKNCMLECMSE